MQARYLISFFALALAILPAAAQEFWVINRPVQRGGYGAAALTRGTCVTDTADATTYNSASFQATGTGLTATDTAIIALAIMGEDSATAFTVDTVTINGIAATEIRDQAGANAISGALYRLPIEISDAATVDVSVTFSEAITSAVVCAWGLKNLKVVTSQDDQGDTAGTSGPLTLDLNTTNNGFALGMCANTGVADSTTWTGLTERQDTQTAEFDYSNADVATTGGSLAITCDWTGANVAVGVSVSFR